MHTFAAIAAIVLLSCASTHSVVSDNVQGVLAGESCKNPGVRKEWRKLTTLDKENWISAINCLGNMSNSGKLSPIVYPDNIPPVNMTGSWYDDLSYVHMDLNLRIHVTGLFFPWHRYFLWSFEQSMRQLCGYKGESPYWDWTLDASDFEKNTLFADGDSKSGLGGWGDESRDYAVPDGGFSTIPLAYPIPHTLRRQYTPFPFKGLSPPFFTHPDRAAAGTFTQKEVNFMVNNFTGDFKGFQSYFGDPEGAHASVHLIVAGDLGGECPKGSPSNCTSGPKWSPNDPLFWLHHAMVDKVWYDWQHKHPNNRRAFEAGTVQDPATWPKYPTGAPPAMHFDFPLPTDGILRGNYTVGDVFDTTEGPLCYVYI